MGKKETNTKLLYDSLVAKEKLSIAEIMELLQVNRKSAYNYIANLEANGVKLNSEKQGRTMFYSLADKEDDLGAYEPITKDMLRSFSIVKTLQEKPREHKELLALYDLDVIVKNNTAYHGDTDFGYLEGTHSIDIKRTQFDKLVKELLENGILVQPNKNGPLYATGKLVPIIIGYDEENYWELSARLEKLPSGHPYHKELVSASEKLAALIGDAVNTEAGYFYNYGRKLVNYENIATAMERLPLRKCSMYIAKFTYKGKNGHSYSVHLATGMIVYSAEKDKLYLMGKRANSTGTKISKGCQILNVDNIESVEVTDSRHDYWQSQEFKQLYEAMFSISADAPAKVRVVFENIFKIKSKVAQLLSQRPTARLTLKEGTIVYEDTISGLDDFASYLRRFGRSCKVEEPEALKKMMAQNIVLSLERYKEAGYGK